MKINNKKNLKCIGRLKGIFQKVLLNQTIRVKLETSIYVDKEFGHFKNISCKNRTEIFSYK